MEDAEKVLVAIKESSLMQNLWKSYQRKFPYAADYSWNDVMRSARKLSYEAGLSVGKPSVLDRIHTPTVDHHSPDLPARNSKKKDSPER